MTSVSELISLVKDVGPYIAALKTHVDLVDDFSVEKWNILTDLAKEIADVNGFVLMFAIVEYVGRWVRSPIDSHRMGFTPYTMALCAAVLRHACILKPKLPLRTVPGAVRQAHCVEAIGVLLLAACAQEMHMTIPQVRG